MVETLQNPEKVKGHKHLSEALCAAYVEATSELGKLCIGKVDVNVVVGATYP